MVKLVLASEQSCIQSCSAAFIRRKKNKRSWSQLILDILRNLLSNDVLVHFVLID